MKRSLALLIALFVSACVTAPADQRSLDDIARNYVRLVLEIDAHEPGYVDAYFGPAAWRDEARANPRGQNALKQEADRLKAALASYLAGNQAGDQNQDAEQAQRAKVLFANISSARFRLEMIGGAHANFADEAERLFALRPLLKPLKDYDAILARIDAFVPGEGALADRVEAFRAQYEIPDNRLRTVMEAAIAECRKRTVSHIALPKDENFRMEMVRGKSWSAYNYYQGQNQSVIQVNTDLPVLVGEALVLGCHEGYPGHHVQGIFNERAYRERGWAEYSVAPLYSPASPLNEGGADFGVDLAFPGPQRIQFEARVLYPLAGLDPATAARFDDLRKAMAELDGAALTICQMYLDGAVSRSEAVGLLQRYQLVARDVAEQSIVFDEQYRSYVINYASGEDVVRAYVDRSGEGEEARWAAYERVISRPTLPSDLAK